MLLKILLINRVSSLSLLRKIVACFMKLSFSFGGISNNSLKNLKSANLRLNEIFLRIISLVERVLEISKQILKPNGILISKIFQGGAQGDLVELMKNDLNNIKYFKQEASRKESPETYLVAKKN